ncbi:hypothetical protein AB1Y20_013572 [Prymnesium parvum]|uniref:BART domain-containing protein n=1 Tax=Prymnesium parvum TaxID=97485 RepID=A0AB34IHV5_PRYPA
MAEESDLLARLEDFFADPQFTGAINEFAAEHAAEITPLAEGEEHPLRYHELYVQYTALVERQLCAFLAQHDASAQELLALAAAASGRGLTCLDYLLASTEYAHFLQLMRDFASLAEWDAGDEPREARGRPAEGQPAA